MILLLVVIAKILVCCLATDCSDGWLAYEGSCYLFGSDDVHFTEAEEYCRHHTSHLVHVGSNEENSFLKGYLSHFGHGLHSYWLGMTDEIVEGVWRWTDDNERLTYYNWAPTEPQNYHGVEDCAVLTNYSSPQYQWADVSCTVAVRALCELRAETSPGVVG